MKRDILTLASALITSLWCTAELWELILKLTNIKDIKINKYSKKNTIIYDHVEYTSIDFWESKVIFLSLIKNTFDKCQRAEKDTPLSNEYVRTCSIKPEG